MPQIEFLGMIFRKQSNKPTRSVSDVRSLLGTTNYVSRFIRNYSDLGAPLRDFTHKGVKLKWQEVTKRHKTS